MAKTVLETVGNSGNKKFKLRKVKNSEKDADIEILGDDPDADFEVQKLSVDDLPSKLGDDDILWFNNFSIKKKSGNAYINQRYKVKIVGLADVRAAKKNIVIMDGNAVDGVPYVFTGPITDDTIELTDGDPGVGSCPP